LFLRVLKTRNFIDWLVHGVKNLKIDPTASKGFGSQTDAYEKGRPDYPPDAVNFLISALGIASGSKIIDLGAGTGKFTRLLLPTGAEMIAIEPVEGMRDKFSSLLPSVKIHPGSAEAIPVAEGFVDAVVVAQAFHWFDGRPALKEIHRVLKPGGKLGLLWNVRDESFDWMAQLTRIIDAHEIGAPRYRTSEWKKAFDRTLLFTPLEKRTFKHNQRSGIGIILERVRSISFIATLDDEVRENVLDQVRELLKTHPQTREKDEIEFPYLTDVYWCRKK